MVVRSGPIFLVLKCDLDEYWVLRVMSYSAIGSDKVLLALSPLACLQILALIFLIR